MRQAITTKYLGPTDTKGSRVKATCQAKSTSIGWDDALESEDNHTVAAHMLARHLGWMGEYRGGAMPDGTGYVFVTSEVLFTVAED